MLIARNRLTLPTTIIKVIQYMSQVKGIPYGISDFNRIRNGNFYFVDKTMYLPLIEKKPSYLFLIRPRRFGKSVFLSMMRTYYDILRQDDFDAYFEDL